MKRRAVRILAWAAFGLVLLIVAAGFAVPHFAADRFGAGAQRALEVSLGRRVKIGQVKYNLFTGPGFTISEVAIYDDPALSAEPILYAHALIAIPRIWPLFAGKLAFSSIRLEDAHINLGRTASPDRPAQWNVEPLTHPALFQAFPNISVVSGGVTAEIPKSRINFKIGGIKVPFYVLIDSLEVRPPSTASEPWRIRLEGEPARSDRPALGFGSFVADGQWMPAEGRADITVRIEQNEIGDIIALLNGHDAGVHGLVSGTARIAGHASALKINGRMEVSGIHGWDQMASSSENWPLAIAGTWNLPGQLFELSARLAGQPNSPVQAHFRVADYLGVPHWGVGLTCQGMPLQPLIPLARQVGLSIPGGVQLNGTLDGAVGFSREGPWEGSGRIANASLAVAGAPPLLLEQAALLVADGHLRLAPSSIRLPAPAATVEEATDKATIQGDYDLNRRALKVTLASRGMDIADLRRHAAVAGVPVLRDLQGGVWKGQLTYAFDPDGPPAARAGWNGSVDVQHATIALPVLALPIRIASVHVDLDGGSLTAGKIQARAGDLAVTGDYRYDAAPLGPDGLPIRFRHRFHLTAARVTGVQLEKLLRPAIYRGGLVSRALGLGRSTVPDWLAQMRAEGTVDIGMLLMGDLVFDRLTSRMIWDGPHIKLANAKARLDADLAGGIVAAFLDADLSGNTPSYHGAGQVSGLPWKGGKVDAELSLDTSGMGIETLANLHSEGSFKARGVESPDTDYTSIEGCFQLTSGGKIPLLKLSSMVVSDGTETYVGSGATAANGELLLDLAGVAKPVRLTLR